MSGTGGDGRVGMTELKRFDRVEIQRAGSSRWVYYATVRDVGDQIEAHRMVRGLLAVVEGARFRVRRPGRDGRVILVRCFRCNGSGENQGICSKCKGGGVCWPRSSRRGID